MTAPLPGDGGISIARCHPCIEQPRWRTHRPFLERRAVRREATSVDLSRERASPATRGRGEVRRARTSRRLVVLLPAPCELRRARSASASSTRMSTLLPRRPQRSRRERLGVSAAIATVGTRDPRRKAAAACPPHRPVAFGEAASSSQRSVGAWECDPQSSLRDRVRARTARARPRLLASSLDARITASLIGPSSEASKRAPASAPIVREPFASA